MRGGRRDERPCRCEPARCDVQDVYLVEILYPLNRASYGGTTSNIDGGEQSSKLAEHALRSHHADGEGTPLRYGTGPLDIRGESMQIRRLDGILGVRGIVVAAAGDRDQAEADRQKQ